MAQAWFFYAIGASIAWALGYALSEKILNNGVSESFLLFVYYIGALPVFFAMSLFTDSFKSGMEIMLSNKTIMICLLVMMISYLFGNYFIYRSIALKNATLTNLVEISYPVFTIFFSWVLFREFHLNIATIIGATLIFSGVTLILLKS